jgi:oxygen-dependent protoporphyrinogen oxidase
VVALAYHQSAVPRTLDGYGYVVPRGERLATLGVLWESSLFPGRAPAGYALLRVFQGGARRPAAVALPDGERIALARVELARTMGLVDPPVRAWTFAWPGAITQYVRGHRERVAQVRACLAGHPGLLLCGSSYDGIAFGAAIEAGRAHADHLLAEAPAP